MGNELATLDGFFNRTRGNVLAARSDDEILLTPDNVQESIIIDTSQIAGTIPTILGERILRSLFVLVILREHRRTLDLNLLILGNTKLETREGDTNGTLMIWHTKRLNAHGAVVSVKP